MFRATKRTLHTLVGLFCAVVLIIGSVYVPMAISADATESDGAASAQSEGVLTFENHPYSLNDRAPHSLFFKESEGIGYDDNYALNFLLDASESYTYKGSDCTYFSRIKARDSSVQIGTVVSDTLYKVTYYVKSDSSSESNFNIILATGNPVGVWQAGYVEYNETKTQISATDTEWVKKVLFFTPSFTAENQNGLYITFYSADLSEEAYVNAYVDNISVEPISGDAILLHYNSYQIDNDIIEGTAGDAVTLPTPTGTRAEFLGWYADKELTTPFTATVMPEGHTNVYAKWGDEPISFEKYPYSFFGRAVYTMSVKNSDGLGVDDDYALNFYYDADVEYTYNGTTIKHYERARATDNFATIGEVTTGTIYKVTYMRKAGEDCQSDYTIKLATAYKDNIFAGYVEYPDVTVKAKASETEWVKEEMYITAAPSSPGNNTLFILLNSDDATENGFVDAYIDNVSVKAISSNALFIHTNNTKFEDSIIEGEIGDSITLPTLTDSKREFLGWYSDEALTIPFTATTLPEGTNHIYAKWSIAPMDFEEYPYTINGRAAYSVFVKEASKVGYDDDYALNYRLNAKGSYVYNGTETTFLSRISAMDSVAQIGEVTPNTLYKVTYYRRSGTSCKTDYTIRLATGDKSNIWVGEFIEYGDTAVSVSAKDTEWVKEEVYISPSFTNPTKNALYLLFYSSDKTAAAYVDAYVDNVSIEQIAPPYVFFDYTDADNSYFSKGEAGEEIDFPENPTCFGKNFKGWFTDIECTTPFTAKTYTDDMTLTVYAGWEAASEVTYTFENYNIPENIKGQSSGQNSRRHVKQIKTSKALSGNSVLALDNTVNDSLSDCYAAIAEGDQVFSLDLNYQYIATVNFYIAKKPSSVFNIAITSGYPDNYWAQKVTHSSYRVNGSTPVGVWQTASFPIDTTLITDKSSKYLYICPTGGTNGIIYFDNITISKIPAGSSAVIVNSDRCKDIPSILTGKPGQSYASKLPKNPVSGDRYFRGYFKLSTDGATYEELKPEDMKFEKTVSQIYAIFIDTKVTQDFDNDSYLGSVNDMTALSIFDFDYSLYDSEAEGNSADNVTSGRYSLYRKGNSVHKENAIVLTSDNCISEGERYTVTFKVKMGKHSHTDGAVKIVSCRSYQYAWDITGDYYPVVAISDLTDGQWHEVSYTFNAVESSASIQTPGGVELFIDDIVFTLATDTPLSNPVAYTEYVSSEQDEGGIDVTTIIDLSLSEGGISVWIIVAIAAGAVIIIGGAVFFILIAKKKKSKA